MFYTISGGKSITTSYEMKVNCHVLLLLYIKRKTANVILTLY